MAVILKSQNKKSLKSINNSIDKKGWKAYLKADNIGTKIGFVKFSNIKNE